MIQLPELETARRKIQSQIDGEKTHEERQKLGQFSTAFPLASEILNYSAELIPQGLIRFIDPAFGTGVFYSALRTQFDSSRLESVLGFEIDSDYGSPSQNLWSNTPVKLRLEDFTLAKPPSSDDAKYNLLICNPPYVRHHHLNGNKKYLQAASFQSAGVSLSGLSGLYCYFMILSHAWLSQNAVSGWLIPSEFMAVNYGEAIKNYLLDVVTLLHIHRFDPDDVQFPDALVSSAVVWFKNEKPPTNHNIRFTFGGSLLNPASERLIPVATLRTENKWTRFPNSEARIPSNTPKIGDYFDVTRGIATGKNKFFILSLEQIRKRNLPISQFLPILPSPRYLNQTELQSDEHGNPIIENPLFVLDSQLSLEEIEEQYPTLLEYLQEGISSGVPKAYLCSKRRPWYSQERRAASLFYCTYIGRQGKRNGKSAFSFILNHSNAIVSNSYLILYPKQALRNALANNSITRIQVFTALNQITTQALIDEGRVYGGGMQKLEPKELSKVPLLGMPILSLES